MVSGWKNGGEYDLLVKVKQISSNPQKAGFEIVEITDQQTDETTGEDQNDNGNMDASGGGAGGSIVTQSKSAGSMGGKMPAMKY